MALGALMGAPPPPSQNLLSLTALRKGPPAPPPVDVELALPKLSLLSPRPVPPPGPPAVTTTSEGGIREKGGAEEGVPKAGVPKAGVPAVPPGGAAVSVPSLDIAVPKVGVTLALPGAADGAAESLGRKMPKLELRCPKVCGEGEGGGGQDGRSGSRRPPRGFGSGAGG